LEGKQFYIGLGNGVRLLSEDWYITEMSGMTKRGFRAFCKSLKVPMVEIGKERYVEATSFLLAMRAITRIGEPDFLAPGCETIRKNRKKEQAGELDLENFRDNFEIVVAELIASKKVNAGHLKIEIQEAARKAADRMLKAGLQHLPSKEQIRYDRSVLKAYVEEREDNEG
jgi:hypothetical protein